MQEAYLGASVEAGGPWLSERCSKFAGLHAFYGESHVLHGVDLEIRAGEVVTLLGRNGAGKTTTLKSIMGMVRKRAGASASQARETIGLSSDRIARLGVALCPEERGIFTSLNVEENLMLPPVIATGGLTLDEIFELFPNLRERLASERRQTFRRRAADAGDRPHPAHRRAPADARRTDRGACPGHHRSRSAGPSRKLKARGFTILLVEQNFRWASALADRFYVMEHGRSSKPSPAPISPANMDKLHAYLGV